MIASNKRGLRNGNPFNIKKSSSSWFGKKPNSTDPVFEQFESIFFGIRAGLKLLLNYVKNGYDTPRKIINRFAPGSENPTSNYIDYVIRNNRGLRYILPDEHFTSLNQFLVFCSRICRFENGLNPIELENFYLTPRELYNIIKFYQLDFKPLEDYEEE